ncbi:MAG: hypothetical protein FJ244_03710 [Nitrospira sp.]|nr:hypothetical protein [Nitrospira sp.]
MRRLALIAAIGLLSACGVAGGPVAPETIGVAPVIERQKNIQEAHEANQRDTSTEPEEKDPALLGQDENLPPLRPVGTR